MTSHFNRSEHMKSRQSARANMPPAEAILWSKLKGRKLLGIKFRRQFGVEAYRLDFFSPELQLGVELDGETHAVRGGPDQDARRDRFIESMGIRILMKILGVEVSPGRRLRRTDEGRDRRRKVGE